MRSARKSILIRIILFISSYFPLYIMVFVLYSKEFYLGIIQKSKLWIILISLLSVMLLISLSSIFLFKKGKSCREITISNVKRPDDTILAYIMMYIVPLIVGNKSSVQVYIVNFLLFLLIGYIYIKIDLIYLNPLWAIFGYMLYKTEEETIIITNIYFYNLKKIKYLKGYYLTNGIYIAHKSDNRNIE